MREWGEHEAGDTTSERPHIFLKLGPGRSRMNMAGYSVHMYATQRPRKARSNSLTQQNYKHPKNYDKIWKTLNAWRVGSSSCEKIKYIQELNVYTSAFLQRPETFIPIFVKDTSIMWNIGCTMEQLAYSMSNKWLHLHIEAFLVSPNSNEVNNKHHPWSDCSNV
jgi:GH15 family glucan-1,4-alpha-glucosidase